MNLKRHLIFILLWPCLFAATGVGAQSLKLWYRQPAQKWTDALPIGNGRMGAMIFGGIDTDRLQFNEQTLWTGGPRNYARKGAVKYLQPIRQLIAQGKQAEAEALAEKQFMGMKSDELSYNADSANWLKKVRMNVGPAAENFDDSRWKTIIQPSANGWEIYPGFEGLDGAVWLRTDFDLPAGMAGKNMVLSVGRIRDMDFTYVNGKLVGSAADATNRKYTIPAGLLHTGKNTIAIQVINFFDKGGLTTVKEKLAIYLEGGRAADGIALKPEWKYWIQDDNPPPHPQYNAEYQPFADVYFQYPAAERVSDYKRDLDISNATAHVSYSANGVNYHREYLASAPDHVIALHLTANKPGKITVTAWLKNTAQNLFRTQSRRAYFGVDFKGTSRCINGR